MALPGNIAAKTSLKSSLERSENLLSTVFNNQIISAFVISDLTTQDSNVFCFSIRHSLDSEETNDWEELVFFGSAKKILTFLMLHCVLLL